MHYYKRNIGDYAKKAARLTILQHGVYNLLIDACYDRERFPTREEAIDWTWASTPDEILAVEFVLRKFFTLDAQTGVYTQTRIEEEIVEYHEFCGTQSQNGKKGGRPKKAKPSEEKPIGFSNEAGDKPTETERGPEKSLTTNQEPLTTNHQPETTNQNKSSVEDLVTATFEEIWGLYPARPGKSKDATLKAFKARLKEGEGVDKMHAGVIAYAVYCQRMSIEPQFIKQPQTFFGPGKHYLADWSAPPGKQAPAGNRHNEFQNRDYTAGVNADGNF